MTAKIFIEPTEDLAFTYDKIVKSGAEQVLVIIPEGANLTASRVSLKLLARMLSRTHQQIVLILDDNAGKRYAREAGIISREKVSDVGPETWEEVIQLKEGIVRKRDNTKMELLSQRQEQDYKIVGEADKTVIPLTAPEKKEEEKVEEDNEITPLIINSTDPELPTSEEEEQKNVDLQTPVNVSDSLLTDEVTEESDEVKPLFKKLDPKLIDLDEYVILSGGDIAESAQASELKQKLARLDQLMPLKTKASNILLNQANSDHSISKKGLEETDDQQEIQNHETNNNLPESQNYQESIDSLSSNSSASKLQLIVATLKLKAITAFQKLKVIVIKIVQAIKTKVTNFRTKNRIKNRPVASGIAKQEDNWTPRAVETADETENLESLSNKPAATATTQPAFIPREYKTPTLTNFNFANKTHIPHKQPLPRRNNFSGNNSNRSSLLQKLAPITSFFSSLKQKLTQNKDSETDGSRFSGESPKISPATKKKAGIVLVVVLIAFLVLSIFVFPAAKVTLKMKQTSIPINQALTASKDIATLDLNQLQLPLQEVAKTNSRSDTSDATGKGVTGNKATSSVTIMNTGATAVTVKAGTIITLSGKSLDFVINNDVNIPSSGSVQNIGITATNLGDNYNQLSAAKKDFTIKTNSPAGITSIFTYNEIKGGTSTEVKNISQSDYDNLKNELIKNLKDSLKSDLKELVSKNEFALVTDPIFSDPQVTSEKKVGDQAETFDISVAITARIPVVNRTDLNEIIKELATRNSPLQGDFTINSVSEPVLSEVKFEGNNSTFLLTSTAQLIAKVDQVALKKQLTSIGTASAKEKLKAVPDVENVALDYTPSYLPEFLRRMPSDTGKINLTIEK